MAGGIKGALTSCAQSLDTNEAFKAPNIVDMFMYCMFIRQIMQKDTSCICYYICSLLLL